MSSEANELYSLLIPLAEDRLIVPRACVAEVVRFVQPSQPAGSKEWMLGNLSWSGRDLPIVAFEVRVEGIAITDEDPDDNGAFVFFGSDETSRDRIRAITGTTTPNVTIPLLPGLEFDLDFAGDEEPMPLTVISSKTDMDTANPRREAWVALDVWSLDALSGNAADWLSMPGERVA